jgi:Ca-activated chloride channel family protein
MTLAHLWILHFLWLLPLAGLALVVCNRQKKKAIERFADTGLLARLTGEARRGGRFLKGLLLLGVLGLMLFALAGPRWGSHYQEVSQKGVDIMVLVDVSASMLVEDCEPNRLERARREVMDFLRVVQGDRVGLVAFSGAAFVQCPLTLDYGALRMFLSALKPDLIPVVGTDLGAAIETGVSSFDFESETDKVILLITDGEDNEKKGLEAARKAAGKGVKIFVFGMGEPSGGPIPASDGKGGFMKDKGGKLILSKLDEQSLREIASAAGGTYARSVAGDLDLDMVYFDGIKSKTKAETLKSGKIKVYEERFPIFLLAALFFLLLEGLIRERKVTICVLLFWLILSPHAQAAQDPDELYRQGNFAEAEKAYAASDMDHPKDLRYRYNRGCAAYQNADYQGAMAAFSSVLRRSRAEEGRNSETRFKAAYNLGNAAFKLGDFKSAVAYNKEAILCNHESEDAKYNLELSMMEMEKQEKNKTEQSETKPQEDSGKSEDQDDQSKTGTKEKGPDNKAEEKSVNQEKSQEPSQAQDQKDAKSQSKSGQQGESEQKKTTSADHGQEAGQDSPKDLSGELKAMQGFEGEDKEDQASGQVMSGTDKKKAEALLDNIKEDRSRFLRFQVPKDKEHGVESGKDW